MRRGVAVIFIVRDGGQKMRAGHRDLHRLARKSRNRLEFVDKPRSTVSIIGPRQIAAGWKTFGSCGRDGLWLGLALKRGNLLPEMVEHRVRRRVAVVGPPMHFAAGDHVDAGDLLLKDGCLRRPQLRIGKIARAATGPAATSRSNASYHRGTLCAPTTVVVYCA